MSSFPRECRSSTRPTWRRGSPVASISCPASASASPRCHWARAIRSGETTRASISPTTSGCFPARSTRPGCGARPTPSSLVHCGATGRCGRSCSSRGSPTAGPRSSARSTTRWPTESQPSSSACCCSTLPPTPRPPRRVSGRRRPPRGPPGSPWAPSPTRHSSSSVRRGGWSDSVDRRRARSGSRTRCGGLPCRWPRTRSGARRSLT